MKPTLKFSPFKPVAMCDALVPRNLLMAITRGVVREYRNAKMFYDTEFPAPEARDGLPFHRRACIESMLCGLVVQHPGTTIMTKTNKTRNCHHRVLVCGRMMLTQSLVEQEGTLPREAKYRQGYARDPQGLLFDDQHPPEEDAPLYGIITHMPVSPKESGVPAFIDIVFPDDKYETIVDKISLLERFPEVLDDSVVDVPDRVLPILPAEPRIRQEQV